MSLYDRIDPFAGVDTSNVDSALEQAKSAPNYVPPPPPTPERGIMEDIIPHYAIGTGKYVMMPIAGMTQIAGDMLGSDTIKNAGNAMTNDFANRLQNIEQKSPTQQFGDIKGVKDAARWAVQQGSEMAPQAAIGYLLGGAGATAGRGIAGRLVTGAAERAGAGEAAAAAGDAMASRLAGKELTGAAEKEAADMATKYGIAQPVTRSTMLKEAALQNASLRGAQAAQIVNPLAMESSSIYQGMKDDAKDPYRALTWGFLAALPDMALHGYLLEKTGAYKAFPGMQKFIEESPSLLGTGERLATSQRLKDIGKTTLTGIAGGTGQETIQTALERIGSRQALQSDEARKNGFWKTVWEKGIKSAVDPDAWNDIRESSAAGGLFGGMEAIGGHGLGHMAEAWQQSLDKTLETPNQTTAATTDQTVLPSPASSPVETANVPDTATSSVSGTPRVAMEDGTDFVLPRTSGAKGTRGDDIPDFGTTSTPSPVPTSIPPTGPIARALNAGGITTTPQLEYTPNTRPAGDMLRRGIAEPVIDAEYTPVYPALPAPAPEIEKAHAWAREQVARGQTHLMQGRGISDTQHDQAILTAYRKAQGATNDLSTVRQETVTPQNLSSVRRTTPEGIATSVPEVSQQNPGTGPQTSPAMPEVRGMDGSRRDGVSILRPTNDRVVTRKNRRELNPTTDDLVTAMSKLGGLDLRQAKQQWGNTIVDDAKTLNRHAGKAGGTGLAYAFKTGGVPLDTMREALVGHGYLPEGATIDDLGQAIQAAAGGTHTYSNQASVEHRLNQAEQEWLSRQDVSSALELSDNDRNTAGLDEFSPADQEAIETCYRDISAVIVDLFDELELNSYDDVKKVMMEARNEVREALGAYEDQTEHGDDAGESGTEKPGENGGGDTAITGDQGRATVKENLTVAQAQTPVVNDSLTTEPLSKTKGGEDHGQEGQGQRGRQGLLEGEEIPEHVVNAVATPRKVMTAVGTATKRQTKETLNESLKDGTISTADPIRLTTVEELHDIVTREQLRPGKDFEGRSGISAQVVNGKKPIVAYGPNDRISAAIVFPESAVTGKGEAPNEVKVNQKTPVKELRFVVDGFKQVMSFDELKQAVGEKQQEVISEQNDQKKPVPEKQALRQDLPQSRQLSMVSQESTTQTSENTGSSERQKEGVVTNDLQPGETSQVNTKPTIDQAAHEAATSPHNETPEPTQAQIEAGNYKKGHVNFHGLDVSIENPSGSLRKGVDENGNAWETKLQHHYGYIKGTIGRDKDHIDVFIGPDHASNKVFIVDQIDPKTQKFDEHKVLLGFDSLKTARSGYLANYDASGATRIGNITESSMEDFKQWLDNSDTKREFTKARNKTRFEETRKKYLENKISGETPETHSPSPTPENIQDFGEHLPGARKDMQPSLDRELSDDDIVKKPLSEIWPKKEVDAIEDIPLAALATAARAEIPAKPKKSYKLQRWVEQVKAVRSLMAHAQNLGTETFYDKMAQSHPVLKNFIAKTNVLEQIPREQWGRVGTIAEHPDSYRYEGTGEDMKKVPSPFVTVEIDGKRKLFGGVKTAAEIVPDIEKMLGVESQPQKLAFEVRGRGESWFINKKGDPLHRPLKKFTGESKIAVAFARDPGNYQELATAWENIKDRDNVKERDLRSDENRARLAQDWRKGKDVTPETFQETFGFRGTQFGNWVSQGKDNAERQGMLNQAYDALMDLAGILNLPPKAISLNGDLGLAFGARGSGWASAHYEPGTVVINLTKTRGAGALAHEWFHALDNYFQRQRNDNHSGIARENGYVTYNPENYYRDPSGRFTLPASRFRELQKQNGIRNADAWALVTGIRPEVSETFADLVQALDDSPMRKRSALIDKGKSGGYWSRVIERAARAFENYVIFKMQLDGYHNDYLANVVKESDFVRDQERYPYLMEHEIKPVVEAFNNLFATVKTKETDKGTALYSTPAETASTPAAEIHTAIAPALEQSAIPIRVVQSVANLPDHIRADMRRLNIPAVDGVFDPAGNLFLVADHIPSTDRVKELLRHEWFHAGVANKELDALYRYYSGKDMARLETIAKERGFDLKTDTGRRESAGELAAQLAETAPKNLLLNRLLVKIKGWLRALGIDVSFGKAEEAEIIRTAIGRITNNQNIAIQPLRASVFSAAWHGSNSDHDRFSMDYVGTGEGNQAYGYGLYFAGKRQVAEHYREQQSPGRGKTPEDMAARIYNSFHIPGMKNSITPSEKDVATINELQQRLDDSILRAKENGEGYPTEFAAKINSAIKAVEEGKHRGHLYKVELAPQEDEYLLWDKPLSEQSKRVRTALREYTENLSGSDNDPDGADIYRWFEREMGTNRQASRELLYFCGIRGIKYLDGSSRDKGEGHYNYVIFDDKDVAIKAKYSVAINKVVTDAEQPGNIQSKTDFGLAPDWLVQKTKTATGMDISGYTHVIDTSAIRHIMKNHGDMEKEAKRGQIGITIKDLNKITDVVSTPDKVVFGTSNKIGREQIGYLKTLDDGSTLYLEEIRTGRHELAAVTMRKYPATMNADSILATLDPNAQSDGGNKLIVSNGPENNKPNYSVAKQDAEIAAHAATINAPGKVTTMTRQAFELAGMYIPPPMKAAMGKFFSNPWFGSMGNAVRRSVVNLNIGRSYIRNEIISDLSLKSDGYVGVEGMINILKTATKMERKQFNELIKYGDRNDVARTFTRDELYRGKTIFGKLSRPVVEAYKAFHEVIQAINRVRFEKLAEYALLPYQNEQWYNDLTNLLDLRMRLAHDLNQTEEGQLSKLLSSTRRRMADAELFGDKNPTLKPVSKTVAAAYNRFMNALEKTSDPGMVRMAYKNITEYRGELDKLKNEWGFLRGFAPRMRKDGDWHVSVYRVTEDGKRIKVYMKPVDTEAGAQRLVTKVNQDLRGNLKSNFKEGERYITEYARNSATPAELLSDRGKEQALEQLIMTAFDKANVFKTSAEDLAAMKRAVLDEVNKEIMAQGFGRHGISREKTHIEGYRDDDYVAVLQEFISGMAGWLSKMKYAIEVNREVSKIAQGNPDDKVWVHNYFKDSMKNSTRMDELAATARSIAAVYYLGFKVSSAVLNAFQNYTVGQAVLAGMLKKAGRKGEPILMLAKAQRDMVNHAMGKRPLNDEEMQVLKQAVRQGTAHAQTVRTMSGLSEQGFGSKYKKVVERGMTLFSWVERYANREPGVLAAYRAFKTTPAGTFDEKAFEKAEEFTNSAHFLMGSENLPEMVRKMGALGKSLYLFQGYTHNYMLLMANALKNGEFNVIARSLGAIAALGGVFALPGADDLDKWLTKWFGKSYKLQFKHWLRHNAKDYGTMGEAIEGFINYGAPSVAGIDMSRAIGVNIPFVSDPDKSFGETLSGVWGGMVKKPVMAAQALGSGQYYRALESIMPEFFANPMRAYRQATTGATTISGKPILDETGHQVKFSGTDVAKKILGFNPTDISEKTELRGTERTLTTEWSDERKDKLVALRIAKTPEETRQAMQDIMRWNIALRASQAFGLVSPINSTSVQRARNFQPSKGDKNKAAWERQHMD